MDIPVIECPSVVKNYLPCFRDVFSKPQLKHFEEYLAGLITSTNHTITGINETFINSGDQSCKNRFLTHSDWNEKEVDRRRLKFIERNITRVNPKKGALIIDDTLNHKTGKHMDEVGKYRDPLNGGFSLGHPLVTSHYACPFVDFPIGFRLYRKYKKDDPTFKTKIELAKELIEEACGLNLPFSVTLIDAWYFSKEFVTFVEEKGKDWVTECPCNRKIIGKDGKGVKIGKYIKDLPKDAFREYEVNEEKIWAFTKTLRLRGWERVRFVIYYENPELKGDPKNVVTNRLDWDLKKIIKLYKTRWHIETFYRDAKQNLGLEDYELRNIRGIKRHWYLVFLAYTLLQLGSMDKHLIKWVNANLKTIGERCRMAGLEVARAFILFIHKLVAQNYGIEEIMTLIFKPNEKIRVQPAQ
jgi:SRSO17 transposase